MNFDMPPVRATVTRTSMGTREIPVLRRRVYTPELASPEEMSALHKALKIERVVIATPSVCGPDNSSSLFGITAARRDGTRGWP